MPHLPSLLESCTRLHLQPQSHWSPRSLRKCWIIKTSALVSFTTTKSSITPCIRIQSAWSDPPASSCCPHQLVLKASRVSCSLCKQLCTPNPQRKLVCCTPAALCVLLCLPCTVSLPHCYKFSSTGCTFRFHVSCGSCAVYPVHPDHLTALLGVMIMLLLRAVLCQLGLARQPAF
jgi:hypothetical protein